MVAIGQVFNSSGNVDVLQSISFALILTEEGGSTIVTHLCSSTSTKIGRKLGQGTLLLQFHQCFNRFMTGQKTASTFVLADHGKEELVGLDGFYPNRGYTQATTKKEIFYENGRILHFP